MLHKSLFWSDPLTHLRQIRPDAPVMYFCPQVLAATAARFQTGFGGLVTYAVKANPGGEVLACLAGAGVTTFDVASPEEMAAVRAACPDAVLHYNNPVRSRTEVSAARAMGVASASVDCAGELDKLAALPRETEVCVRLALPVPGAAYDFGAKFGVGVEGAAALLRQVAAMGFRPGLCFHPGTQCADPAAWGEYIRAAAQVAQAAGVMIGRLNVGGGFAAHRSGQAPDLEAVFDHVAAVTAEVFEMPPGLVCEPGRAMVAEAFTLAAQVKAVRPDGSVFLNDGIYGALAEARDMDALTRVQVVAPCGRLREAKPVARVVYGPTCDSLDRLPEPLALPRDLAEGDYLLFAGMGAYSRALATRFNGYGPRGTVTVSHLG